MQFKKTMSTGEQAYIMIDSFCLKKGHLPCGHNWADAFDYADEAGLLKYNIKEANEEMVRKLTMAVTSSSTGFSASSEKRRIADLKMNELTQESKKHIIKAHFMSTRKVKENPFHTI